MRTLFESEAFQAELPGWGLRGALCAANSAAWAWLLGFRAPAEIAGMVAGVACWVAVFAAGCAWTPRPARWRQPVVVAALKWAAWIKIGLTAGGWLLVGLANALGFENLSPMALLGTVDMLLGLGALWLVALLAGLGDPGRVAALDSFGWTALATVTEGALMAGVIMAFAALVWAFWQVGPALGLPGLFSPARFRPEVVRPPGSARP